ncbi:heme-binding protein [Mucilaginibacter terrenus]|uniref:Heme-binding protein n=1 Tax=Mucilaginibacter terrenus TaxID=2482727 RepID=A0A3E2NQ65_9SPHI|nr:heme-binding protein [Mucilaginibacter terrenus]RFZ83081.1 heme-binding protein [Mucilaginibacter terrenus]
MNITLAQAEAAIAAAKIKAAEINTKMDICVVDPGSNLVAFARMDGAWLGSVDISFKKAKTAAWFTMDTAALSALVQPGQPLYNIEHSNGGLITFPGGVVIKNTEGEVIGAIGVSGSTVEDDYKVAVAGAAVVQ